MSVMLRVFMLYILLDISYSAKILGVFPNPSISHQSVFRSLVNELIKRGHEVIIVTTVPEYQKGAVPENLTEIDVPYLGQHYKNKMVSSRDGNQHKALDAIRTIVLNTIQIMDAIFDLPEVKDLINSNKKIDLLLIEFYVRPALVLSHLLKAPIILVSSFGSLPYQTNFLGGPIQPLMYPLIFQQRLYDLTFTEKLNSIMMDIEFHNLMDELEEHEYGLIKKRFGENTPSIKELYKNVQLLFDIEDFLNSSDRGVVYVSFGTNVNPSVLPSKQINNILKALSRIPYNVIFKWDSDKLPEGYNNIKFFKWLPQSTLLMHPKVKAFVTQGGLQSTDEAINAGVPLVAIPIYADQYYNSEKYVLHKIGIKIHLHSLTEEEFKTAVETVVQDPSYKSNILKLRSRMREVPIKPLDLAASWAEHIIQFGGTHLQPLSAHKSWIEYYEIELILTLLTVIVTVLSVVRLLFSYIFMYVCTPKSSSHLKLLRS